MKQKYYVREYKGTCTRSCAEYLVLYTRGETQLQQLERWAAMSVPGPSGEGATLRDLQPGATYYFRVQARNAQGYGPKSDVIRLDTRPTATSSDERARLGGKIHVPDFLAESECRFSMSSSMSACRHVARRAM